MILFYQKINFPFAIAMFVLGFILGLIQYNPYQKEILKLEKKNLKLEIELKKIQLKMLNYNDIK